MQNQDYIQFEGMDVPKDIPLLPKISKEDITRIIDRKIDIHKTFIMNFNTNPQRLSEVNIHTADIGANYVADFDFSDLSEIDAWRKTCRLKSNLQQFEDVDFIRCEGFLHKVHMCEVLTFFEEWHRMLKVGGEIKLVIPNILKLMRTITSTNVNKFITFEKLEKQIFSPGDSTGIYYNRTIWTFERLKAYIDLASFSEVENLSEQNDDNIIIKAVKRNEITPDNNARCFL